MGQLYDKLIEDVRFTEGIIACINCGTCTAICPAAEVYDYQPRIIADTVQSRDDKAIEALLKSETIWYCGECMLCGKCTLVCPRNVNTRNIILLIRETVQTIHR